MTTNEIVNTLHCRAKIEPGFTRVVLAELEEKNPNFFKKYHVGVTLKRQIIILNQLMERQYQMQCTSPMVPLASMQNRICDLPDTCTKDMHAYMYMLYLEAHNFALVPRMMMDRIAADTLTPSLTGGVKSDIAMNPGLGSKWSLPDDQTGNHVEFHNHASQVPSTSSLSDLAAVFSNVGGGPDVPLMPLHLSDNTELGNYTQSPFLQAGMDVPLNSEVHTDVVTGLAWRKHVAPQPWLSPVSEVYL
ncbi:hypothetical protein HS088_TW08G00050 [Tripterygium wilfordii]|uniref:Uncharacterized protein n=1 Tax=Tripterygium wilfordii TaxID=458696 RepID=A0A7J7DBM7_TRIWF|nr:hypothetical protein HS088_TW08G00050 [Tripterygium wilfordii]